MTDLPTSYTSSDGRQTPITGLENGHLHNAFRKRHETAGADDPMTLALRAEVLARYHKLQRDPMRPMHGWGAGDLMRSDDEFVEHVLSLPPTRPARPAPPPGPASQAIGANNPPPADDRKTFEDRLNADNGRLVLAAAALEARAANLPKVVESDADVAAIDAWIREAAALERNAEKDRETAKAPWLMRGQVVDAFFGGIKRALSSRTPGLEQRKRPYLIAKRRREEEEQRQREAAERQAAEEQRQREEEERQRAAAAQRRADEAAETLRQAEARRSAEEAAANAQAEADDAAPDLTLATDLAGDVDDAEAQLRDAHHALDQHTSAADSAGEAAREAERRANAAAGDHALPKVASSSLVAVWRHRFTSPREFDKSLGPLGPFIKEAEMLEALARAAKADPRPAIPGVEWYEDFEVKTDKRGPR